MRGLTRVKPIDMGQGQIIDEATLRRLRGIVTCVGIRGAGRLLSVSNTTLQRVMRRGPVHRLTFAVLRHALAELDGEIREQMGALL